MSIVQRFRRDAVLVTLTTERENFPNTSIVACPPAPTLSVGRWASGFGS